MQIELNHNGQGFVSVSEFGFTSLSQHVVSQGVGYLEFEYHTDLDAAPLYAVNDTFVLRGKDTDEAAWVTLFRGSMRSGVERSFHPNGAVDTARVVDVWADLDTTTFQRDEFEPGAYNRSHVVMFRDQLGERMSAAAQIEEILIYAEASGVEIQHRSADFSVFEDVWPPAADVRDLTCGEAIRRCLRWMPDTFTLFDYESDPPVVLFENDTSEEPISVHLSTVLADRQAVIRHNDDKALRGVVINYEVEDQLIDGTTQRLEVDSYGETTGRNVLVLTTQLTGDDVSSSEESIPVVTQPWPGSSDYLFAARSEACEITSFVPSGTVKSRYITSGYIPGYGDDVVSVVLTWRYNYKYGTYPAGGYVNCNDTVTPFEWRSRDFAVTLLFTDETDTLTKSSTDVVSGESVPEGFAKKIYETRKNPLYSGELSRLVHISQMASPRNNLSVVGSLAEYETMRAPVQQVRLDWFSEIETIMFGYPQQAGVGDFVDMLRANRTITRPFRR